MYTNLISGFVGTIARFVLAFVVLFVLHQSAEAKLTTSDSSLSNGIDLSIILDNKTYVTILDFSLNRKIVNVGLFTSEVLSIDGVIDLLANNSSHKKFKIIFDHRIISKEEILRILEELVQDGQFYTKKRK